MLPEIISSITTALQSTKRFVLMILINIIYWFVLLGFALPHMLSSYSTIAHFSGLGLLVFGVILAFDLLILTLKILK